MKTVREKSIRVNMQFREDVKAWIEEESSKLGISQSALVNICVSQYRQQQQAMDIMSQLPSVLAKFEELGIKNNEQ